jgi:phosphatidylglycerol:prolipoprotein diacylglycerol transferase
MEILAVWQGGMSFHGGFLGVMVGTWLVARKHEIGFFKCHRPPRTAGAAAASPPDAWATSSTASCMAASPTLPWGMLFLSRGATALPRHPSQLYQFALEGVLLFIGACGGYSASRPRARRRGVRRCSWPGTARGAQRRRVLS